MGFFDKLKKGLSKTREMMSDGINRVFASMGRVDEDMMEELFDALISADVGMDTTDKILDKLRASIKENKIIDPAEAKDQLIRIIAEMIDPADAGLKLNSKPAVIFVIGVNGVGKTTSIGKMANNYRSAGKKVVVAAADTFRAAAIDQLQVWTDRAGVDLIKQQEGADPSAVLFDAINAAKSRSADILIVDTAGRLHTKKNLMEELNKMNRVLRRELPDADINTLIALDATTGQNGISQAKVFSEGCPIDGIILTKLDGTAKGGVVISIKDELGIPVRLVGVGEGIDDLLVFEPQEFVSAIFND
ncbi:MAG: signal recognition particle-docking protein FtsY [Clostridia bacterium]|nr:signal recognition particle-docking protein FtsY [Clostridia bacterium]